MDTVIAGHGVRWLSKPYGTWVASANVSRSTAASTTALAAVEASVRGSWCSGRVPGWTVTVTCPPGPLSSAAGRPRSVPAARETVSPVPATSPVAFRSRGGMSRSYWAGSLPPRSSRVTAGVLTRQTRCPSLVVSHTLPVSERSSGTTNRPATTAHSRSSLTGSPTESVVSSITPPPSGGWRLRPGDERASLGRKPEFRRRCRQRAARAVHGTGCVAREPGDTRRAGRR